MHNNKFQNELEKIKVDTASIENDPHKAFIERLKKQILSDESSSSMDETDTNDDDVCSEELMKELEAKLDALFANIDNDDD